MGKKVLIYEGASGHGECLSSYYAFFKKLGYDVDFVIRDVVENEKPLWMIEENVTTYIIKNPSSCYSAQIKKHMDEIKSKVPNLFSYDFYFISTLNQPEYFFVCLLCKNGVDKQRILHQNHLDYMKFLKDTHNDITLGQNGFTLGTVNGFFPQLSPSVNISKINHQKRKIDKNEMTIFISGLARIHFKNFELLVDSVEKLNSEGMNININITGVREQRGYELPKSKYINYLGRIDFKNMAKHYCEDDFLLVLFDENALVMQKEHDTFLNGRVSGSRNMSIMYKIPLVVQKPFQLSWGLDDNNSISFLGHDYEKVLLKLFSIKKEQYNNIIESLEKKEKEEFDFCVENLKTKIASLDKNKYNNYVKIVYKDPPKPRTDFIHYGPRKTPWI